jgi:transcriptional regulator with XRE-family HTH domain
MPKYPKILDTRKLETVAYDPNARTLSVRFDDGCMATVSADTFKEFPDQPPVRVAMNGTRHAIEFHFADGTMHDVAADYITWLTNEDYARAYPEDQEIGPRIGSNVARLRKDRGISQVALAAAAEMQPSNLSRLESGKHEPTLDVLLRVASALGVALAALMDPPRETGSTRMARTSRPRSGAKAKTRAATKVASKVHKAERRQ